MERNRTGTPRSRPTSLATCIAGALALAAPVAWAAPSVWHVDNCNDTGAGSLRAIIDSPATLSGDTIDLSARTDCVNSTISLAQGELRITQDSLTLVGPGRDKLALDGTSLPQGNTYQDNSRVLTHVGGGTLEVHGLTLSGGHVYHSGNGYYARGGCVYSAKDVVLDSVDVRDCSATSLSGPAVGGGVYAKGDVTLADTTLSGNGIGGAGPTGTTRGGGIAALGMLSATGGSVSDNSASSTGVVVGAGISSKAGVVLDGTAVTGNIGTSSAAFATGGGIYVRYKLSLTHATVSGNAALAAEGSPASAGAGAAFSLAGPVAVDYSTIDGNSAIGAPQGSDGGGIVTSGNFTMTHSTVSNNTTSGFGGGIVKGKICANCAVFYMRDSTVSGNHAGTTVGGVELVNAAQTKLLNSTIAFNTADSGFSAPPSVVYQFSPGLHIATSEPTSVLLHSMLISNNTYGAGTEVDFTVHGNEPITFNGNVNPANSLIRVTPVGGLPGGIITGACPLLGPLRDNGGPTKTHALLSTSPAIDAGDNVIAGINAILHLYEQRGGEAGNDEANYLRMSGPAGDPSPLADIGAYEVQQDDVIFNTAFDGCEALP